MPALAASTPVLDGRITGYLDSRMSFYGKNSVRVPSVPAGGARAGLRRGRVSPGQSFRACTGDMAPLDPEGRGCADEFLNARGR
jgi:hypothetical protein